MILFVNTYLTDKGFLKYDRGLLPPSTPPDVFRYMLASLSVLPWSRVIIYYELDENYRQERAGIDAFIRELYPQVELYAYRNEKQKPWQEALTRLFTSPPDELVWFTCNHDHIFIDYETGLLDQIVAHLTQELQRQESVSCAITHWPEKMACQTHERVSPSFTISRHMDNIAIQIVSQAILRKWFFDFDYGDAWIPRTDLVVPLLPNYMVIPGRELVRHFDGYSHTHLDINVAPPLFIPPGFFEHSIRLQIGGAREEGTVLLDPSRKNYSTVDPDGADLKGLVEDIPLFWRSRIAEVRQRTSNTSHLFEARNQSLVAMACLCEDVPVDLIRAALRFEDTLAEQEISRQITELESWKQRYLHERIVLPALRNRTAPPHKLLEQIEDLKKRLVSEVIERINVQFLLAKVLVFERNYAAATSMLEAIVAIAPQFKEASELLERVRNDSAMSLQ